MARLQYRTVTLDCKPGFLEKQDPDLAAELNRQASEGWRLLQILEPARNLGETARYILVLERQY